MKKYLQIIFIILFMHASSPGADFIPQKAFVNFSVENGIPYASVEEIHFDMYGNLWYLGSNDQIYYFDGRNYFRLPLKFIDSVSVLNNMMVLDSGLVVSTRDGIYFIGDSYSITPEERELSFLPEGEYTKIVKQDSFFYSINMDSNQVVCFTLERLIHKWNFRDPLRYLMVQDSMMVISTDTKKIILYKLMNHVAEYVQTIELNFLKKNFYIEPIVLVNHHLFVLINEYGIISIRDFFSPEYKIQSYTRFFPKDINLHYILFKDKFDDSFWTAGFYEGLYRWTPNGKLEYITEENGLANNLVRSVLQDQFNRLWFGTQNGISVLKKI